MKRPLSIPFVDLALYHEEGLEASGYARAQGKVSVAGAEHLKNYPTERLYLTDIDPLDNYLEATEKKTTGEKYDPPEYEFAAFSPVVYSPPSRGYVRHVDNDEWQIIERKLSDITPVWTITVPNAGSRENAFKLAQILNENEQNRVIHRTFPSKSFTNG